MNTKQEVLDASVALVQTVLKDSDCVCDRCTKLRHFIKTNTKENNNVQQEG